MKEETTILWYHVGDISDKIQAAINQIPHNLVLYANEKDLSEALDTLAAAKNKILFVLNGNLSDADRLLSSINTRNEIVAIFILNTDTSHAVDSLKKHSKLYEIFVDYENLIDKVSKTARILTRQFGELNLNEGNYPAGMSDLSGKYNAYWRRTIYYDVINTDHVRQHFFRALRQFCPPNRRELKNLEEFEQTYVAPDALKWYTKDSFLFKFTNYTLRYGDGDALDSGMAMYFVNNY